MTNGAGINKLIKDTSIGVAHLKMYSPQKWLHLIMAGLNHAVLVLL